MSKVVEIGDCVRDLISGFVGIVVKYEESMFSSDRALVAPQELNEGAVRSSYWFDTAQLEVLTKQKIKRPMLISGLGIKVETER